MKESHFFEDIKGEIEKKEEAEKTQPLTAGEHEETEEKPMTLKDQWLSLRYSIQEKLGPAEKHSPDELERIKLINELVSPEVVKEYRHILHDLAEKTRTSKDHPHREFIDLNDHHTQMQIENWVQHLVKDVSVRSELGLGEQDIEKLKAQSWLLFDAIGNVMNTNSLEKDITEFYQDKTADSPVEKKQQKSLLVKELRDRYPMDQEEIEILVDITRGEGEKYPLKTLIETINRLWDEYKLGEKKGAMAKISLGYLLSKGAESFAPSLYQNILTQDQFRFWVFLEVMGMDKLSEYISTKTEIELAKVTNDINQQINERITNSLFFQEFEFIHEKSLGEVYAALERGKHATEKLISDTISKFAPTLAGIGMSLAFLTKINPALGAIGLGSLPFMYVIAKKQNEKTLPMYEKEKLEGEKILTRLGSIKSGFEEIKTSSETPAVARQVKKQMDTLDTLSLQRFTEEAKARLKRMIPYDVSSAVAAGVGTALQQAGMISGGAVLSTVVYSSYLNRPIQDLVNLYFNEFSRSIKDIERMEGILGEYEKLDLPEGEKEMKRLPVSELENFDISIRNLRYKNILRGVNLDVPQGEFLTIAGASGAGKSTLLRNLVGLYKPGGGDIEIGGVKKDEIKKYGRESLYSVMSYSNQSPQLFDDMTLRENLLLWSKNEVTDEKIKEVLRDLHLDTLINRLDEKVKHLSGGEKVRMGVARTLIKGAKIMLLDEPSASLDSQAATEVRKVIGEIHAKYPNTTIICVSHDEGLIKISERSVNMEELQK